MLPSFVFRSSHLGSTASVCLWESEPTSNHSNSICWGLLKQKTRKCALMHECFGSCANQFFSLFDVISMDIEIFSFSLLLFMPSVRVQACNHYLSDASELISRYRVEASCSVDAQRFNFQALTEITSITRANKWKKRNKMRNYCLKKYIYWRRESIECRREKRRQER